MKKNFIAILVYGEINSDRNPLSEEKYKGLADAFAEKGFRVDAVLYNDLLAERLAKELLNYNAVLVWVNPIELGTNREKLDSILSDLSKNGCYVSAHPEVILKIGTKEILFNTREMEFAGDVKIYSSFDEFRKFFLSSRNSATIRILKQYRGNGGKGVFKIELTEKNDNKIKITQASGDSREQILTPDAFFEVMKIYFLNNGKLIDQEWNHNIINGIVRCYLTGTKVSGFGYQEINALYPAKGAKSTKTGKRFYFTEDCGLFQDLRMKMESEWVPRLQKLTSIKTDMMPVIWDADFFINKVNEENTKEKYMLCEINVSCVSPFPESAIPFMVEEVRNRLAAMK